MRFHPSASGLSPNYAKCPTRGALLLPGDKYIYLATSSLLFLILHSSAHQVERTRELSFGMESYPPSAQIRGCPFIFDDSEDDIDPGTGMPSGLPDLGTQGGRHFVNDFPEQASTFSPEPPPEVIPPTRDPRHILYQRPPPSIITIPDDTESESESSDASGFDTEQEVKLHPNSRSCKLLTK
jgi:hypothetical protein